MLRRFFDMPLLLVTGFVFGFVGSAIIVALWGDHFSAQAIRTSHFNAVRESLLCLQAWRVRSRANAHKDFTCR